MSSYNSDINPSTILHYSSDFNDNNIDNHSLSTSLFALNDTWILSIFILCLCGILFTIIISLIFICLSYRRLNGHFLLTNLFICFSVCFIYIIIIIFLIRANELFCGLREFLSQFSYALLYSALLCRYIMQWLGSRILSKRTKQLASLLIYILLIFIQIPIGILWWYFTIPRFCQQGIMNILLSTSNLPKFIFHFKKPIEFLSCSNRCIVDYRFYATFTYTIIELFFCTIISICLFFCRHCHRNTINEKTIEKLVSINGHNPILTFSNMFAFILIDFIWLTWTFIYYYQHPFYIFPSLIISMFIIATICLVFILLPQIYYYSKLKLNNINTNIPSTTLYSNKLASTDDINIENKSLSSLNNLKKKTLSNKSELSYELGDSGTFLPITRTPKGPFKVTTTTDKRTSIEKLDKLIYGEHHNTQTISNTNDIKVNSSLTNIINQQEQRLQPSIAPIQRQSTSSSIGSDFVTPVLTTGHLHRQNSDIQYYSAYPPPRRDETIIPILCTSERPRTSTPVQMRLLVNSQSSSVPTTRRINSGTDLRYIRHPYDRIYPPPPPTTPPYYSPQPQQYLFVDPYRTMPSRVGGNTWHSVLLQPSPTSSHHYPYSYRRFHMDNRSLSQRLWDIDSGDDDEDEEDIVKVAGRVTPSKEEHYNDFRPNQLDTEDNILLHIDDDEEEEEDNSYKKQYAHV